jgi:hypothetical protein
MINVYAKTAAGVVYHAVLPWALTWVKNNPRQKATMVTLVGNEIQQYSAKSTSAGTLTYSQMVDSDQASIIDNIDMNCGECYVSDGDHAYKAVIDAKVLPSNVPGKNQLEMQLSIIRRVI